MSVLLTSSQVARDPLDAAAAGSLLTAAVNPADEAEQRLPGEQQHTAGRSRSEGPDSELQWQAGVALRGRFQTLPPGRRQLGAPMHGLRGAAAATAAAGRVPGSEPSGVHRATQYSRVKRQNQKGKHHAGCPPRGGG